MSRILLGANYYPEDWDDNLIDWDIEKMKECGFNVVRIAEFAWKKMEPAEGNYSFDWLHNIVDKMYAAGIGVIMGTPTATPPSWFSKKYPEALMLSEEGMRINHGGRRHCCSNNPDYIKYSMNIVERLAKEFGNDKGVIGWQIDNEIYHVPTGCCCEYCMTAFHNHLAEKYGDVDGVNQKWNLNLFSQAYDEIEDIPAPINAWHNPHIIFEWNLSHEESHKRFVHMQAEIIKKYSSYPIGTDMMPMNGFDYRELNAPLDVVQFNHYWRDFEKVTMWMDYVLQNTPAPYPDIENILKHQKEAGGLICVVSHSSKDNILRDYRTHFGFLPDAVYGWELPEQQRKPNPYPLQDIMRRFSLTNDQILVVDDMKLACKMAAPLGIAVAYAGWNDLGVPEIGTEMNQLCNYNFHTIQEFEEFLF